MSLNELCILGFLMYKPLKINILGIFSNFFSIIFGKLKYLLYIWTVPFNDRKEHFNNKK